LACPPPAYYLDLQMGNQISKKLVTVEDSLKIKVQGYHMPLTDQDYIYLSFRFEGLREAVGNACYRIVSFKSNRKEIERGHGWDAPEPDLCRLFFNYPHAEIESMTVAEFRDYLDSTSLSLTLRMPSGETREINVLFDRDWLIKRWVPKEHREALKE